MVEVNARVDDDYMTLHFPSIEDAINYVSFEYEYYSKLYINTGRFNAADTKDCVFSHDNKDHHCELYNAKLRLAYIDAWDAYVEWNIRKIN